MSAAIATASGVARDSIMALVMALCQGPCTVWHTDFRAAVSIENSVFIRNTVSECLIRTPTISVTNCAFFQNGMLGLEASKKALICNCESDEPQPTGATFEFTGENHWQIDPPVMKFDLSDCIVIPTEPWPGSNALWSSMQSPNSVHFLGTRLFAPSLYIALEPVVTFTSQSLMEFGAGVGAAVDAKTNHTALGAGIAVGAVVIATVIIVVVVRRKTASPPEEGEDLKAPLDGGLEASEDQAGGEVE
jgi:hypothetical protein